MFFEYLNLGIFFIFIIIITGIIIALFEHRSNSQIYTVFGKIGLYINSMIGTPVHEFGHLFFAILFFKKIAKVKLIPKLSDINSNNPLGYVEYYSKNSFLNNISLFFIGIGPIFSGSLTILILMKLLLKNFYGDILTILLQTIDNNQSILNNFFIIVFNFIKSILNIELFIDWKFYIFIFLSTCIASHMSLSFADLKISFRGFIYFILFIIMISIFMFLFNLNIIKYLTIIISYLLILCIISIIFSFLNFLISYILLQIVL